MLVLEFHNSAAVQTGSDHRTRLRGWESRCEGSGRTLQEVLLWLLLGLCGLQRGWLGAGEAGVQHRLSHQQDWGRGAAAGAVHICIQKHGLALWILGLSSSPADLRRLPCITGPRHHGLDGLAQQQPELPIMAEVRAGMALAGVLGGRGWCGQAQSWWEHSCRAAELRRQAAHQVAASLYL